jgi:hypothetical protein
VERKLKKKHQSVSKKFPHAAENGIVVLAYGGQSTQWETIHASEKELKKFQEVKKKSPKNI